MIVAWCAALTMGFAGPGPGAAWPFVVSQPRPVMEIGLATLGDALEAVQNATGVQIRPLAPDEKHDVGLDLNALVGPLELPLDAERAIELILERVEAPEDDRPTWQPGPHDSIRVGHRSRLNEYLTTRTYDIEDMLVALADFSGTPKVALGASFLQVSDKAFGPETITLPISPEYDEEASEELVRIIKATVEPQCWAGAGRRGPSIRVFRSQLVVRAPGYVHRALGGQ